MNRLVRLDKGLGKKLHAPSAHHENRQKPGRMKFSRMWAVPAHAL